MIGRRLTDSVSQEQLDAIGYKSPDLKQIFTKMMTEQQLMYASDEDKEFFYKCIKGLPDKNGMDGSGFDKFGLEIPFSCGPHSVKCLREIVEIVKPKAIFEIGFNHGHSASLWLELSPEANLTSCDISLKDETIVAARMMKERYGARFEYFNRKTKLFFEAIHYLEFQLAFIDGGHEKKDVIKDINFCLALDIPYISFDDFLPQFGQVQDAIALFPEELIQINVNGNIALYKNNSI